MKWLEQIVPDPATARNFALLNEELKHVRKLVRNFHDATTGTLTVILPDGYVSDFDQYHVKTDTSGFFVVVTAFAGQTIEGVASVSLTSTYDSILLTFHRGKWYRMDA